MRYAEVMAFARLERDFPVIEGPRGSLPLAVVASSEESATARQRFPCLQRALNGRGCSVATGSRQEELMELGQRG